MSNSVVIAQACCGGISGSNPWLKSRCARWPRQFEKDRFYWNFFSFEWQSKFVAKVMSGVIHTLNRCYRQSCSRSQPSVRIVIATTSKKSIPYSSVSHLLCCCTCIPFHTFISTGPVHLRCLRTFQKPTTTTTTTTRNNIISGREDRIPDAIYRLHWQQNWSRSLVLRYGMVLQNIALC